MRPLRTSGNVPTSQFDSEVLMTLARACRDEVEAGFDYPSGSEVRRSYIHPGPPGVDLL